MKMLQAFVRAVWTIFKKDLRVWLRQPSNVAITVLPALALLFIDALSTGAVGRSPVALVMLDQGARGQQMAQVIHHADLFRVSDATQAQALYKNLDVVAIVIIPANFTQACPNQQCPYFEITDASIHALVGDGKHGQAERIQTFRCQACRSTFSARRDTPLYRLKIPSRAGRHRAVCSGRRAGCFRG
jgi:hypothetical protein